MKNPKRTPFFAVDVGNTRTKIALWFDAPLASESVAPFPPPDVEFADASETFEATVGWLSLLPASFGEAFAPPNSAARWLVSSVNRRKSKALETVVRRTRPADAFRTLTLADIPIPFEYDFPEKLGLDRVVAAFAGTRLLGPNRPFLTIDVGTAATIDFVDASGVFRGGAILPGPRLIAESLRAKTEALPALDNPEREGVPTPNYPATETQNAIRLGVAFAPVGAVAAFYWRTRREIVERGGDPTRFALLIAGGDGVAAERNLRTLFDDLDANFVPLSDVGGRADSFAVPRPEIVVEPRLASFGLWEIARTLPSF